MKYKENIRAILECYFTGFKDEIIDSACNRILEQEPILDKIRVEIGNINLNEVAEKYEDRFYGFQREVIKIIDKYKGESA